MWIIYEGHNEVVSHMDDGLRKLINEEMETPWRVKGELFMLSDYGGIYDITSANDSYCMRLLFEHNEKGEQFDLDMLFTEALYMNDPDNDHGDMNRDMIGEHSYRGTLWIESREQGAMVDTQVPLTFKKLLWRVKGK